MPFLAEIVFLRELCLFSDNPKVGLGLAHIHKYIILEATDIEELVKLETSFDPNFLLESLVVEQKRV